MVATPIGNLADITLRALHVLASADCVACEDTRHTGPMLRAYGIDKPLLAIHEHNEASACDGLLARLGAGERVAYVSDAGTPAISDPGARLAAAARAGGFRVIPIAGPSSVAAALSAAGADASNGFVFLGFREKLADLADQLKTCAEWCERPVVLFEAPHRIAKMLSALAALGDRTVTVCREITKQFEDIATMPARALPAWAAQDGNRCRGEFVIVVHAAAPSGAAVGDPMMDVLLAALLPHVPLKTAVATVVTLTKRPKNTVYEAALALKAGVTLPSP